MLRWVKVFTTLLKLILIDWCHPLSFPIALRCTALILEFNIEKNQLNTCLISYVLKRMRWVKLCMCVCVWVDDINAYWCLSITVIPKHRWPQWQWGWTITFTISEDRSDNTLSSSSSTTTPTASMMFTPPLPEQVINVSEQTVETDHVSTSNNFCLSLWLG